MAKTGSRQVVIRYSGDGLTTSYSTPLESNAASPAKQEPYALSTGFNSITCPSGVKSVTIVPPVGSTVALTLKGINGDTGFSVATDQPTSLGLPSGTATIGITAASSVTVMLYWT